MNNQPKLRFCLLSGRFAICRLSAADPIPSWAEKGNFTSITRTAEELSIVCPAENVPTPHKPETPWICLKIEGPFAFSQVGTLRAFIHPLAENGIPIFAIATFDTDYVLIQGTFADAALKTLQKAGHQRIPDDGLPAISV